MVYCNDAKITELANVTLTDSSSAEETGPEQSPSPVPVEVSTESCVTTPHGHQTPSSSRNPRSRLSTNRSRYADFALGESYNSALGKSYNSEANNPTPDQSSHDESTYTDLQIYRYLYR